MTKIYNTILDLMLGWFGLVMFLIIIAIMAGASVSPGPGPVTQCETLGGKYVQIMKSYHECVMPK
jgi:lipopolysaccharide/colanic/teichoic acid biosynthesis glycosyltransferase